MNQEEEPLAIKLVCVGDGSVGKTCILLSYTQNKFPTDYVPTVFDNYTCQVTVDGRMINFGLWDTAGQETYNQLRQLSYGQADVFLIVLSVVEQSSLENALQKWLIELNKDELQKVPKIIVGNKTDMRDDNNSTHVRKEAAEELAKQNGVKYLECSALTQDGLKEVFDEALTAALKSKQEINQKSQKKEKEDKKSCCSLI